MTAEEQAKSGRSKQVIVVVECTVTKEVVCENCTVEEARADPWAYAVDETETNQIDWRVKSAKADD